ncbi:MAG: GNAT family N-acetyltransferase [Solirubrobacteraceae bacterium]|nr:GNAT family N-acetyltransferase [Solirubrobacteraceae bacterium]
MLARSDRSIAGYYTLVVGHVEHDAATPHVAAGLSARFPVPVCIIARLAIDNTAQGRGLGAGLVLDALQRVLAASELVGIRAVVVHALHDRAAHFYTQFGFEPVGDDPRTLMVPLQAVRAVLGDGRA